MKRLQLFRPRYPRHDDVSRPGYRKVWRRGWPTWVKIKRKRKKSTTDRCITCRCDPRKDSRRRSFVFWRAVRIGKKKASPGQAVTGYRAQWRCETCKHLRNGTKKYPARSHEEIVRTLRQTTRHLGKAEDRFKTLKPEDVTKLILRFWSPPSRTHVHST
jgi:hypothetical protein